MGELTPEQVRLLTGEGIDIDGENCKFVRLVDRGGEGANHWYHVVLKEGKNREVRRMFEAVGIMVSRLMRVRYGPVELPAFLKRDEPRSRRGRCRESHGLAGGRERGGKRGGRRGGVHARQRRHGRRPA
jgi:23S rRNA pseudouridine2605 synthase